MIPNILGDGLNSNEPIRSALQFHFLTTSCALSFDCVTPITKKLSETAFFIAWLLILPVPSLVTSIPKIAADLAMANDPKSQDNNDKWYDAMNRVQKMCVEVICNKAHDLTQKFMEEKLDDQRAWNWRWRT
jgi:hypothetical protein